MINLDEAIQLCHREISFPLGNKALAARREVHFRSLVFKALASHPDLVPSEVAGTQFIYHFAGFVDSLPESIFKQLGCNMIQAAWGFRRIDYLLSRQPSIEGPQILNCWGWEAKVLDWFQNIRRVIMNASTERQLVELLGQWPKMRKRLEALEAEVFSSEPTEIPSASCEAIKDTFDEEKKVLFRKH